jgi:YHS domain-containing protein
MMTRPQSHALPAWMLSTAAATGLFVAPALLVAQSPVTNPPSNPPAAATAAPVADESAIQKELRRLYAESGREMPEVSPSIQIQAQSVQPPKSAPAKPNPVTSFFKRLVPGSQPSQQAASPASPAPKPSAPVAQSTKPTSPPVRYAPHSSQPPRRLPAMDTAAAAPQPQPVVVPAPQPAAVAKPPVVPKVTAATGPALPPSPAAAAPAPVVNDAPSLASDVAPEAPATGADSEEFPNPFTSVSEIEADLKLPATAATPFKEESPEGSAKEVPDATTESAPSLPFAAGPALAPPDAPVLAAPDELPPLPVLPDEPKPAVSLAPAQVRVTDVAPTANPTNPATEAKMAKIRERGGMKGLKGFCPVTLRNQRELQDAQPEFQSSFRGQKFHFATADAKSKFDSEPMRYAPAVYGADVVVLIRDKDVTEGTLDFAAWYKGHLFLFSSEENSNTFLADPAKYAVPAGVE